MSPERYLPETMGPGVAFLDYDNDGWMDIYVVNSGACDFFKPKTPLRNALYRNNRDGTFTDVTEKAGVAGGTFGMGVAVGDYDNDGYPDLFVTPTGAASCTTTTATGPSRTSPTRRGWRRPAGPRAPSGSTTTTTAGWTCSSAASSSSGSTGTWSAATTSWAGATTASRASSSPPPACCSTTTATAPSPRSRKGTAIAKALGKALGVVATDVNNDGRLDLFVANDTVQNFLFVNRGGRTSGTRSGSPSEVGFSANGQPRSGMGVDAADIDGDGWQDLFVANVDQEMFALYRNNKDESFQRPRERPRDRPGHAPAVRLGPEVLRLRQRRPGRPAARERPSRRHGRTSTAAP